MSELIENLPGHPRIKTCLKRLIQEQKVPSTLLFEGPRGVGKARYAEAFAKELLQGNALADLRHFSPEGKTHMHPMQAIKQLIKETELPPFQADRKVFIVHEAERMLPSSANALLKTLEEPEPHSTIILLSSHSESLLPTIVSRCLALNFSLLSEEEIKTYLQKEMSKPEAEARKLALLSHGVLAKAERLAGEEEDHLTPLIVELGTYGLHQDFAALNESLKKVEAYLEKESSIPHSERTEDILFSLFYWYRDLHLLKMDEASKLLFFGDKKEALKACLKCPLPSLEEVQKKIERARQALELNINFSHALSSLFY